MRKSREYAVVLDAERPVTRNPDEQNRKFQDLARELECDEDEAAIKGR